MSTVAINSTTIASYSYDRLSWRTALNYGPHTKDVSYTYEADNDHSARAPVRPELVSF